MPCACAVVLSLPACERNRLKTCSNSLSLPHRLVIRAKIVRLAAAGLTNAVIAARLGLTVGTVGKWRGRFATDRLDGLTDRPRSGRPPHSPRCNAPRSRQWPVNCLPPMDRAVEVELPGTGCRGRGGRDRTVDVSVHGAPDLGAGRDQTVAVPVLDLHPGPSLRGQGQTCARPLPANVGRPRARRGRVRDLLR